MQKQESLHQKQSEPSSLSIRIIIIATWLSYVISLLLAWASWGPKGSSPIVALFGTTIEPLLSFVSLPVVAMVCLAFCQIYLHVSLKNRLLKKDQEKDLLLAYRILSAFLSMVIMYLVFFSELQLPGPSNSFGIFATFYTVLTMYITFPITFVAWNAYNKKPRPHE